MSFLRKRFNKYVCRVCKRTFCCETCRVQHEKDVHNIVQNCDICCYGRITSSRTLQLPGLFEHIKEAHCPLHCLYCKVKFSTVNDLLEHTKCAVGPPKMDLQTTKTPMRPMNVGQADADFNSPPVNILINQMDIGKIFGTSTPMQGEEVAYEMIPETITPVDNMEKKAKIKLANDNLSIKYGNEEHKNKRKVTFNETPQMEHVQRFENLPVLKSFNVNIVNCHKDDSTSINESISVKDSNKELSTELSNNKENQIRENPTKLKRRRSSGETLWQSAMEDQLDVDNNDDNVFKQDNCDTKPAPTVKKIDESSYDYNNVSNSQISFEKSTNYTTESFFENYSDVEKSNGLWSSMAFVVKNVVKGLSRLNPKESMNNSNKRLLSDPELLDGEMRNLKRIKLTEIKCRPPIRNHLRKYKIRKRVVEKVDKSTQTDDMICPKDLI